MARLTLRHFRRMTAAFAFVAASLPLAAQATSTATLTQDGWWSRLQGPVSVGPVNEPANPLRQTVNPQIPKPPTVPDNAIAVGAAGAEPSAVAAVGFILDDTPGALVSNLVLTLKEAPGSGNQNAAAAKIAACPITGFWAGARNAAWENRPTFECADPGAAIGERAPDGTWTFNLTTLGQSYVDGLLEQNGVALAPAVGSTDTFQVSFLDIGSGGVSVQYSATAASVDPATGDMVSPVVDAPFTDVATGEPVFEAPLSGDALPLAEQPPQALPGAAPPAPSVDVPAAPVAAEGDLGLPGATWLLLPLSLVVAAALAYTLGPAGRPEPQGRRSGGVSRALAARGVSEVS